MGLRRGLVLGLLTVPVVWVGPSAAADPPKVVIVAGKEQIVAENYERRTIYHSPQTPGYTCWVGTWIMPDDSLMASFTQATGPLHGRPRGSPEILEQLGMSELVKRDPDWDFTGLDLRNVYLRSQDGGANWTPAGTESFHTPAGQMSQGGPQVSLRDGTILRTILADIYRSMLCPGPLFCSAHPTAPGRGGRRSPCSIRQRTPVGRRG